MKSLHSIIGINVGNVKTNTSSLSVSDVVAKIQKTPISTKSVTLVLDALKLESV